MKLSHAGSFNGLPRYRLDVCIFNGEYVDGGTLNFYFYLDDGTFSSLRENDTLVYFLNSSQGVSTDYELQEVLVRVSGGETQLESAALRFSMSEGGALTSDLDLSLLKSNLSLAVEGKENNLAKIMVFAAVLFVVAFSAFSAIMTILKSVYELQDNPRRYSLVTICLTCMWDAALCIISFIYAFSDQESLMLFIMPAFLLCLLFTNLQPRLMILIYQQSTNSSIREIICKFNLFHYGTLFLIYPLLLATNLNFTLFLLMASIFFPQIYTNALTGTRPELSSPYYIRYLLVRMLIIVNPVTLRSISAHSPTTSSTSSPTIFLLLAAFSSLSFKYLPADEVWTAVCAEAIRLEEGDSAISARASVQLQVVGVDERRGGGGS